MSGGRMKRFYVLTPVAVLLLVFLVLVVYAGRPGEGEPPGQDTVKLEQKEAGNEPDAPEEVKGDYPAAEVPADIENSREDTAKVFSPPSPNQPPATPPVRENHEEEESGIVVGTAVIGKDGELLYGPGEVALKEENRWGITALGALEATGLPYVMSTRYPDFVIAVAGQYNKGQSGWMYKVNDEVPLVAASQKTVQEGDRVIWWYSTSLQAPPPSWEQLVVHH